MNNKDVFPFCIRQKEVVYLDSAATSLTPQSVIDAMNVYYTDCNANIHRGAHATSVNATTHFEAVREKVARFCGIQQKDCGDKPGCDWFA